MLEINNPSGDKLHLLKILKQDFICYFLFDQKPDLQSLAKQPPVAMLSVRDSVVQRTSSLKLAYLLIGTFGSRLGFFLEPTEKFHLAQVT